MSTNSKLLALTLTASLATFGCTTNWNRGDGEPATGTTNATSPAATPGSSGGALPQPMTSSSQITTRTPEEALAVMQQSRPTVRGIVLGPVNPPNTGQAVVGGAVTPAFDGTIRQLTVNSSISNPYGPQAAVVDDGGGAAAVFGNAVSGTTVATPSATIGTTASRIAGTAATAGTTSSITAATPTSAALPVTSGAFSAATGTLTPTASSAAIPSATVATSPVVLGNSGMLSSSTVSNGTTTATAATGARSSTTAAIAPVRLNRSAVTTSTSSAITVSQSANGRLVISNQK